MPLLQSSLRNTLSLVLGVALALPALHAAAEPIMLFGSNGVSREWPPHSWGGLDIGIKGGAAAPSYSVKLKETTEPYAGLTFKSSRGHALPIDPGWREKGLVVVRLRLGTDFYGTPLKVLELKLALSLLLPDGKIKNSGNKIIPIHAGVDDDASPIVIVAPFGEFIDPSLASMAPISITGLTLQHGEAPTGSFEIIECAFVLEQD